MKKVTVFESLDGRKFTDQKACEDYESLVVEVAELVRKTVGDLPDDTRFANGGGFLSHSKAAVAEFKAGINRLYMAVFKPKTLPGFQIMGRYLCDADSPAAQVLNRIWTRAYSTDAECREWGQPFYALNPGQGAQQEWVRKSDAHAP